MSFVGVVLEHVNDFLLPAHVLLLCKVLPLVAQRLPHETAVLSAETKLRNVSHPLIQERLVSATDDPDSIGRVGSQGLQSADDAVGWNSRCWVLHDRCQGTIIVEHEKTLLGLSVLQE